MATDVRFSEAARTWLRIGLQSFGGPAGQIAVMHRVVVDEKRWVSEARFLHALSFCTLLPGPEAMQLATYLGWLMHRVPGGLVAGLLFVLPGAAVMLGLSFLYARFGRVPWIEAAFLGVKAAVLALVLEALLRIGRRALRGRLPMGLAAGAFAGLFALAIPFPVIVLAAGAIGALAARAGMGGGDAPDGPEEAPPPAHARPDVGRALRTAAVFLALWLGPVSLLVALKPGGDVFREIALFFSQLAVVTFGGAYAVLAYVAQRAVEGFGWLSAGEMLDGLGLAETTPGPLILVLQHVAFLAAWKQPGALAPGVAGTLAAALALWVTFVPCFLWIFVAAPWVESVRESRALRGALAGITAAVVGVIANLSLWFALHVVFARVGTLAWGPIHLPWPELASLELRAAAIAAAAIVAALRFGVGLFPLLVGSALAGLAGRALAP